MSRGFRRDQCTWCTISRVYLSPSEDTSWEDDLLGDQTLADSEVANIVLLREHPAETWDLKVQFDDGEEDVGSLDHRRRDQHRPQLRQLNDGALADVQ